MPQENSFIAIVQWDLYLHFLNVLDIATIIF